jgi:hypothetical protein
LVSHYFPLRHLLLRPGIFCCVRRPASFSPRYPYQPWV